MVYKLHFVGASAYSLTYSASLSIPFPGWVRLELPRAGMQLPPEEHRLYSNLINFIQRNTSPEEKIFILPNMPGLYFLADRDNPTPYDLLYPGMLDEKRQRQAVRQIEAARVKFIFLSTPLDADFEGRRLNQYAKIITDYIQQNYEPFTHFGGVQVWERKPD